MKDSLFWKKTFIPVYFIIALLSFILFKFYIKTDNMAVYLMIFFLFCLGIASIIINAKQNR
ncbi:hypothetical protein WL555_01410 [Staphylococcus warneri]|uniref:Uncharacterized protein n=2 Tax=Staphylococcus warneri TaxID=1292 RepID=A0A364UR66_STAWA|nr:MULTISPECIES: hypothetical protein [Staphylococcus]MBJ7884362.1 hypothetical protein [Bacillaceae bacterium HSR45]PAK73394.1 hypothetical protein B8W95_05605 [Staphylococcus pasteuri]QAV31284.1 hypothetical protein SD1155_06750 [Sulfitobacter donghicola]AGC91184.1 hypothetical protein A284_09345 [Staphylococcus warneri SG1]KTW19312.1 membrane protein [Staphylococcus warneri]